MKTYPSLDEARSLAQESYALVPIGLELPSDTLTPVSAFLRLRAHGFKQSFLLESADGGEDVGRYSFLGIDPFANLCSDSQSVTIRSRLASLTGREQEPIAHFNDLGKFLRAISAPQIRDLPPFVGGAVGFVSYDSVSLLENIPLPEDELHAPTTRFMFFKTTIIFDRLKHRLFLVTHIESKSKDFEADYKEALSYLSDLNVTLHRSIAGEALAFSPADFQGRQPITGQPMLGREAYCEAVRTIKNHIRRGDIFQCVLSDRFRFPISSDPFLIYRILRMLNPSPYLYYLSFDDEILLGSSPEMLVKCEGDLLQTCPIAGTRPRGMDSASDKKLELDMLASVKEKAEHLMLVDLGRNDLGRVSRPGSVSVTEFMKVERYSHVMHLVSLVEGRLKRNLTAWEALGACFPAGTLSGAPKIRAMQIISELEPKMRGPYGGAVVYHDFHGSLNSCITIRSLYIKGNVGYAQAGAGIVADSRPEKEYDEVINKAKAIRTAVAIAEAVAGEQG